MEMEQSILRSVPAQFNLLMPQMMNHCLKRRNLLGKKMNKSTLTKKLLLYNNMLTNLMNDTEPVSGD